MFTREKKQRALALLEIVQQAQEAVLYQRRLRSAHDPDQPR
jgi:hypothetical protein